MEETKYFEQHIENNCSYYREAIMKHVKEMNKYFGNHHKPRALLFAHMRAGSHNSPVTYDGSHSYNVLKCIHQEPQLLCKDLSES